MKGTAHAFAQISCGTPSEIRFVSRRRLASVICRNSLRAAMLICGAALLTKPAAAHLSPGDYGSFAAGLSHPFFGTDHLLAMTAVGLWASVMGGRAFWVVPATFVATMICGFVLALLGAPLPLVEPMILASVVVMGLLIALAVGLDLRAGALIAGFFALFHGYAHGGELGAATAAQFGAGFIVGTALLHAAGVGLGVVLGRAFSVGSKFWAAAIRGIGAATAATGLALFVV